MSLPFNAVEIHTDIKRRLSVEEFLEIPMDRRILYILDGSLHFFRDREPVSRTEALNALCAQSAAQAKRERDR